VGLNFSTVLFTLMLLVSVVYASGVGVTGFEPAAFRSQSGCATKLRYTPVCSSSLRRDHRRYYGLTPQSP
jgi:hypothetical protein